MNVSMKKNKYLPINWVNGTKLTERHFVETHLYEVATHQELRALQLTAYNYGLGCTPSLLRPLVQIPRLLP